MTTILHGDHTVQSRARLTELREQAREAGREIIQIEGKEADMEAMVQSLESHSLFSQNKLVVVENLISSLRPGKKRDAIIAYLVRGAFDADALLWEGKSVGRSIIKLKRSKHVQVHEFKTPTAIFSFVDSMAPNNASQTLYYFEQALGTSVPEVIFSMIVRQFRLLIGIAVDADIPDVVRLAPWQRSKLKTQASLFSGRALKTIYRNLLLIDYQVKTGKSPYSLTSRIEQFIMSL